MEHILVGSEALSKVLPNFYRTPGDIDYFMLTPGVTLPVTENRKTEGFYHPALTSYNWSGETASLDELYTIKVSHLFWTLKNQSWNKHYNDVLYLQQKTDAQFIPELYNILYPIWEEIHGKKETNLEQDPELFFNKNVKRVFEHDSIHASVSYYEEPLFNRILRDNHEVAVDKSKFDNMPGVMKLQLVREEVYATALERQVIPSGYNMSGREAYGWALKKTFTSFSKGWFALYIVLNLSELSQPDTDFVGYHLENSHRLVKI